MSFVQTLWASLAQTYSIPDHTAPADNMIPQKLDQLYEQQDAALGRLGQLHTQQQPCHSQQLQLPELSPQLRYRQYLYPHIASQGSFYAAQYPQQYTGAHQYTNACGNGYGGYATGQNAQHGGFTQPTASSSSWWPPPNHVLPNATENSGQAPSIHWAHGYPSSWARGSDAYGYWQAQQQQRQQHQHQPLPPPPLPAQPQHTWPGYYHGWSGQHQYSVYTRQATPAYNSFLSPAGVPFDLQQCSAQVQLVQGLGGLHNSYRLTHSGQQPGSHIAFNGVHESIAGRTKDLGNPPYETQRTTNSLSTQRASNVEDFAVGEKSKTALVRYELEPKMPHARPYQSPRKDEYMEWDEQYAFGIAAPKAEMKASLVSQYPPAARRGGPVDKRTGGERRGNISPVSSYRAHIYDEKQHSDDKSKSTPAKLSRAALFRTHDRPGCSLRRGRIALEDADPEAKEPSSQPLEPAFHAVQARQTPKSTSKVLIAPPVSMKPVQLLEHSVDSHGPLQTTTQELCAEKTIITYRSLNNYVLKIGLQGLVEDVPALHKQHVSVSDLKELAGGITLSKDKQQGFDAARNHDQGDRKPAVETNLVIDINGNKLCPESIDCAPGDFDIWSGPHRKSKITNASRIHHRSMTNSSLPSPPTKRVKAEPDTSSNLTNTTADVKTEPTATTVRAASGWGNFAAHIARDDRNMAVKAREGLKRLGGDTFRPEFRETYKDQKGKKETTVHDKSGGSATPAAAAGLQDKTTPKHEERETGRDAVIVDRAYDTDSSDGGVALSPSDLGTESWVFVKTGDEDAGWKRD